jgi:uncharacterized protein YkwD
MNFWEWLANLFGWRLWPVPTPVPTPSPTPPPGADLVTLHNRYRATHGLPPLTANPHLMSSAQAHADDMAARGVLGHTGSDGSSPFQRMTRAGYSWSAAAENIARGSLTPAQVMALWESDLSHWVNIMGPYRDIGIGRNGDFWCVDFGSA